MSTSGTSASFILTSLPAGLREPLIAAFNNIIRNFRERRWEPSELNGGKLCEIVYSIVRGHVDGKMPSKPTKPSNFVDACRTLEKADQMRFSRSMRIQIPRMLIALYEIRNNRGVGHVGGDVDPNHMDAVVVVEMSKWLLAELVRVFHQVDTKAASATVEALIDRTIPIVWETGDVRRVLRPEMSLREQTLVLLHSTSDPVNQLELLKWLDLSNAAAYRRDVLRPAHKARLLEFDEISGAVRISPTGIALVEQKLPLEV